jgi:hypothetical protein
MARGLRTLWHKRVLLRPHRFGVFAWMLYSHKLARWLVPWALALGAVALAVLAPGSRWAAAALAAGGAATIVALLGWTRSHEDRAKRSLPRLIALPTYAVSGNVAGLHAWITALGGSGTALWEPTRRGADAADAVARLRQM